MKNQEKYFVFGIAPVNGYYETVYLTKSGKLIQDAKKEELMLFNSEEEVFKYKKLHQLDLAEWDKLSNF